MLGLLALALDFSDMAASLILKLNDTYPPVETVLESTVATGVLAPIDLSLATEVKFPMKKGATLISGKCTFPDPPSGRVIYAWVAGQTSTVGEYRVEWEVHWSGGGIESIPNEGYNTIEIQEDLG